MIDISDISRAILVKSALYILIDIKNKYINTGILRVNASEKEFIIMWKIRLLFILDHSSFCSAAFQCGLPCISGMIFIS